MKSHLKTLGRWIAAFLWRRAVATWPGAKGNWLNGWSKPMSWMYVVWAGLFTLMLVPTGFEMGFVAGLSFLVAALSAWYFGYIFRDELVMVYVYVGGMVNGTVQTLLVDAFNLSLTGQLLPVIALIFVFAYFWIWSERMKRSDFDWEPRWTTRLKKEYRKRSR